MVLCASFSGCSAGLQVTACVVDSKLSGFQCIDSQKKKSFVSFSNGSRLKCASPHDLEDFLKSCKNHKIIKIPFCSVEHEPLSDWNFYCLPIEGPEYKLTAAEADNYFCMSDRDRKRVEERCLSMKLSDLLL